MAGRTLARMGGSSLVEVLVSMALVSVGLLGLLAAHATALRLTKLSAYQSTAQALAQDVVERVRANLGSQRFADVGAAYHLPLDWVAQSSPPAMPTELCNTLQSVCTSSQMAAADLAQWRSQVRARLPQGAVYVQVSLPATLDVWVAWQDPAVARSDELPSLPSQTCPAAWTGLEPSVRCLYTQVLW